MSEYQEYLECQTYDDYDGYLLDHDKLEKFFITNEDDVIFCGNMDEFSEEYRWW